MLLAKITIYLRCLHLNIQYKRRKLIKPKWRVHDENNTQKCAQRLENFEFLNFVNMFECKS